MNLQTPIKQGDRIHKMYASRLEKLGILTFEDFLYHIPNRYEDYSLISKIATVQPGEIVTIQGSVTNIKNEYTRSRKTLQKATIVDDTGSLEIIWFNQPYLVKNIQIHDTVSLSGRVDTFKRTLLMQSPEYEIFTNANNRMHTGRLVPIYPETRGISSKWLRRQIFSLLHTQSDDMKEFLPESILKTNNFMPLSEAIAQIHFPTNYEKAFQAKERLAFDELFLLHLKSKQRRAQWEQQTKGQAIHSELFREQIDTLIQSLPFQLTHAQKTAITDILSDFSKEKPMNRLLQGDVGSGKTIVAAICMYLVHLNGFQSIFMAPTEILAQQHFNTINKILSAFGIQVDLVTGSKKSIKLNASHKKSANEIQHTNILVGTHALLNKHIELQKLGFVVIDEQQRFGVQQRGIIREKGINPHVLTMTATPIPRTVALTMYGDLDLSYLSEMPYGRKRVKTWLVPTEKRDGAYAWIRKQIQETDSQAFIICPFIEESESMQTVKAAATEYEHLRKEVFSDLQLGLLHGRLKSKEKDVVLEEFRKKNFMILVATPVVEVGIDIPNATIIMIEASDRFGLAQLHQLRGRVGRGEKQSYCLLFTESKSEQTQTRLKALETTYQGAQLAELDLKLRGPGDMYGTMQHGLPKLKVATFSDFPLIQKANKASDLVFQHITDYPLLLDKIGKMHGENISPD